MVHVSLTIFIAGEGDALSGTGKIGERVSYPEDGSTAELGEGCKKAEFP